MEQKSQNSVYKFSVPNLALPDKANQIKIGWEMEKHFLWFSFFFWNKFA